MTTRPLGAQISHMLAARGVDTIFGIPGVHNQEMYRGIEEAGITHVLARHEQGAGFMADGYARASGRPGVCYVITGPGLTNAMTPLGQAYSDSVPVLAISSCLDETAATQGQLHQMKDQRAAAETVCDWSHEARTAQAAYALIDRALQEFETLRPRPKHIQVPIAALEGRAPEPPRSYALCRQNTVDISACFDPILAAKRPLFILGGGAKNSQFTIQNALSKLGAAAFETYAGRGLAQRLARNFGTFLARSDSADVIGAADVVVLVGTELAETDLWRTDPGLQGRVIHVDVDPASFRFEGALNLQCTAGAFFEELLQKLEGHTAVADWTDEEVANARATWRAQVMAERPGITQVADALYEVVADMDCTIFSDMTQFAYAAKETWPCEFEGRWHHPTGFGTLGYALPAAIGGVVARGGAPTMAIAGDYGFQYTVQELGTAVELGLPLPIILWDNGKLKEIEESMVRAQIPPNAVIAHNPDFVALAKAYGAYGEAPKSLAEMQELTRAALEADGPTLIYVTPEVLEG
ncbi:MAG: thiamine pyrophosphate-dependent enzyme [Rhodobacteraceae bacterium]|nr:thiamine pyrophosphate-dependent enzyme [Paracoccaceae bacterium]